jgi:hypothetical protein
MPDKRTRRSLDTLSIPLTTNCRVARHYDTVTWFCVCYASFMLSYRAVPLPGAWLFAFSCGQWYNRVGPRRGVAT